MSNVLACGSNTGDIGVASNLIRSADVDFQKNKLTENSGAFRGLNTMLFIHTTHLESTRAAQAASAAFGVYLCGAGVERGSSFIPVAQPRNLDWLGPGS